VKKDAVAAKIDGRIVGVADGDTVIILDAAKVQHKIRLDRIDVPEKKQAFGEKAKQHLSEMGNFRDGPPKTLAFFTIFGFGQASRQLRCSSEGAGASRRLFDGAARLARLALLQ
jgi:hypothetical protein